VNDTDIDTGPAGAEDDAARRSRLGLAAMMLGSGVLHFLVPSVYARIVPRWVGDRRRAVLASGVVELVCGGLLLGRRTRAAGGWLTAATLVAVYPANIHMAVNSKDFANIPPPALWARLPVQFLFGWMTWRGTR